MTIVTQIMYYRPVPSECISKLINVNLSHEVVASAVLFDASKFIQSLTQ